MLMHHCKRNYWQMKWGTRQHSWCLLWHQQSLVQLFTLTMGSTQWDLHLTAPLYPHEHISAECGAVRFELRAGLSTAVWFFELICTMLDFAGDFVFCFQ
ncbi:Enoyl-[acyl-carrier-protein] reductase [NADH] chloroplastic [Zea mays]|uniref:Enoyl-[acyl-carrier-protein] reductase [NADH] chloroplastic n=1 Tax=Zea mays TaxID=4577 RepID=A0A1D6I131_MAIZE|nr:Enoyl-[acyl-carrier-protein] reductase [NADH] chloroplastic [Zea mays]